MDRIELRGLRAVGTHGALPEEQTRPQPFEVDIDVVLDLSAAGRSDDLEATIDYGAAAILAARVITDEHHVLLERMAVRIADLILDDGRVEEAVVTVRKLRPPVPVELASAAVTVRRGGRAGGGAAPGGAARGGAA